MSSDTKIIEIYINSYLDRLVNQNEVGGKFTVILPYGNGIGLDPTERDKTLSFKINSLQMPNVLLNFSNKTSRFWWEQDYDTATGTSASIENIQINTNRLYTTPASLITELNDKIQAVNADLEFSFDDLSKKITLTNNHATEKIRVISSFRYGSTEQVLTFEDINDRLGFSQSLVGDAGVIDEGGGTLTGTGIISLLRTNNYYLTLAEAVAPYNQTMVPAREGRYNVVGNIGVGPYGTVSTLNYVSAEWFRISSSQRNTQLSFEVLDDEFDSLENELPPNIPITMSLLIKIE